MKRVVVVTDSTAGLPAELAVEHGLHVIPLWVHFGEQGYRDGVDLSTEQFYHMLTRSRSLPTTSQPAAGEFLDLYRSLAGQAESIVSIHISSDLSGTVASALAAREMFHDVPVQVIDSRSASMGLGMIALAAARVAAQGGSAAEVAAAAQALVPRMNVIFAVDTLEYLHKGGRIGGGAALLGSIIHIKPILDVVDGRIEALDKVRSRRKAQDRLLEIVAQRAGRDGCLHACVISADAPSDAEVIRDRLAASFSPVELYLAGVSPTIGTHVGPGTAGICFYSGE